MRNGQVISRGAAASAPGTRVEVHELFAARPRGCDSCKSVATEASCRASGSPPDLALTHPGVSFTCRNDGRVVLRTAGGTLRDAMRAVIGAKRRARAARYRCPRRDRGGRRDLLAARAPRLAQRAGADRQQPAGAQSRAARRHRRVVPRADSRRSPRIRRRQRGGVRRRRSTSTCIPPNARCDSATSALCSPQCSARAGRRFARRRRWARTVTFPSGFAARRMLEVRDGDGRRRRTAGRRSPPRPAVPSRARLCGPGGVDPGPRAGSRGDARPRWTRSARPGAGSSSQPPGTPSCSWIRTRRTRRCCTPSCSRAGAGDSPAGRSSQLLLMPVVVECGPDTASRVADEHDFFSRCGFAIEQFGPGAVRCSAVPVTAAGADPERAASASSSTVSTSRRRDRGAPPSPRGTRRVPRGRALRRPARRRRASSGCSISWWRRPGGTTCPHGRPSVLILDDAVLRRAFRRPSR